MEYLLVLVCSVLLLLLQPDGQVLGWGTAITAPTRISPWMRMRSQDDALSFLSWRHSLNALPVKVDVQVKPVSGPDQEFIFPGIASAQRDSSENSPYGGILYKYNETYVLLYAPNNHKKNITGYAIFTGDSVWKGPKQQQEAEVLVRVRVWGEQHFSKPDFQIPWKPLRRGNTKEPHRLGVYPAMVIFRFQLGTTGYVADGIGYLMRFERSHNWGAVLYAYDDKEIRIWKNFMRDTFVISDGWGRHGQEEHFKDGNYSIMAWKSVSSTTHRQTITLPTTNNTEVSLNSAVDLNCDLLQVMVKELPDGFNQLQNANFLFMATGSVQSTLLAESFGGVVFSYSKSSVRAWYPPISQNPKDKHYYVYVSTLFGAPNSVATKANLEISIFKLGGVCNDTLTAGNRHDTTNVPTTGSTPPSTQVMISTTTWKTSTFTGRTSISSVKIPTTASTSPATAAMISTSTWKSPPSTRRASISSVKLPTSNLLYLHLVGSTPSNTKMVNSGTENAGCRKENIFYLTGKYDVWIWFVLGFVTCLLFVFLVRLCQYCSKSKKRKVKNDVVSTQKALPVKQGWGLDNI